MFVLFDQVMTGTKAAVSVDTLSNFDAVALVKPQRRCTDYGEIVKFAE